MKAFHLIIAVALLWPLAGGCKKSTEERRAHLFKEPEKTAGEAQEPYYPGLIEEYLNVLAGDPNNRAAIVALANAFYDSKQWREAIEYYEEALRLEPHDADIRTDLGTCYRNIGMPDRAISEYRKARTYNPGHLSARYNLGVVYAYDKKDAEKAIREWEELLSMAPGFPHAKEIRRSIRELRSRAARSAPQ